MVVVVVVVVAAAAAAAISDFRQLWLWPLVSGFQRPLSATSKRNPSFVLFSSKFSGRLHWPGRLRPGLRLHLHRGPVRRRRTHGPAAAARRAVRRPDRPRSGQGRVS